jgi:transcription elongation factor Elf1
MNLEKYILCPRCDGSGLVYRAYLPPLNEYVLVCDECEAMWLIEEQLASNIFQDFTTYIAKKGYKYKDVYSDQDTYFWYQEKKLKEEWVTLNRV